MCLLRYLYIENVAQCVDCNDDDDDFGELRISLFLLCLDEKDMVIVRTCITTGRRIYMDNESIEHELFFVQNLFFPNT